MEELKARIARCIYLHKVQYDAWDNEAEHTRNYYLASADKVLNEIDLAGYDLRRKPIRRKKKNESSSRTPKEPSSDDG